MSLVRFYSGPKLRKRVQFSASIPEDALEALKHWALEYHCKVSDLVELAVRRRGYYDLTQRVESKQHCDVARFSLDRGDHEGVKAQAAELDLTMSRLVSRTVAHLLDYIRDRRAAGHRSLT
jgi:hypothetical protein